MQRQNAEHSIVAAEVEVTSSNHGKGSLTSISTPVESHVSKETKSFLKDLSHFRLRWEDIVSATNNFAQEHIITTFRFGTIRKGRLLHCEQFIDIIVKKFYSDYVKGESKRFWTEVSMLSSLKHKNLVSFVGFYEDMYNKMIIYKQEASRSLDQYLSHRTLTWKQRLKICVGVAKALSYIHYDAGRDFSVIVLAGRGFLKICTIKMIILQEERGRANRSPLLSTRPISKSTDPSLGKWTSKGFVVGSLTSLNIFSETAYCCIKEERADRPYIYQVVKGLEKALELQSIYENLFQLLPRNGYGASSSHLKWKNLEHLKIALNDIELATENFADKYRIGSGAFGMVYKAQLEHFDSGNSWSIDGENICGFPKKQSTVAIKCIKSPKGEQGFQRSSDHMILVYELASKGSLEDYLGNSDKMINLTWLRRLKICLDIAHGLNYIHTNVDEEKQKIIHRDIKSANILLGDNWVAKIADFGLSKLHPTDQEASTLNVNTIAGTNMYLDPEYQKFGRLNKKSDIYSFGVVLFEILTGRVAYDRFFTDIDEMGIKPIARHHFEKGKLMEIVDHKIKEETDEHVFSLSKGPNDESLDIFTKVAFRCLAMTQVERPSIDVVIDELKKALYCQENHKDSLKLSLQDIKLATKTFNQDNLIGHGDLGNVYKGHTHGHNIIAAKRLGKKSVQGEAEFMAELEILMEYKHEHVISLVGYCDEDDEKIIVYEYASRGSLDKNTIIESVHEDYEKWEPKLPKDYKDIIHMSKCPEIYSTKKKEDLYNTFTKGILLQQDKVLLSFDGNCERNEIVSGTMFSYKNSCPHEWKYLPESRTAELDFIVLEFKLADKNT
ncbi:kinase-like domain, phloem protein 2-like protein, partial [Tanacetum coccineum]